MVSKPSNLINLLNSGVLKKYEPSLTEINTHIENARKSLNDASLPGISDVGLFGSLYAAAHQLTLAAFKIHGYRTDEEKGHRQNLFAALEHAVPATEADKHVFDDANKARNRAEYDGMPVYYTESQIEALHESVKNLQEEVELMFKQWKTANPAKSISKPK